jgi:hypothetical protein
VPLFRTLKVTRTLNFKSANNYTTIMNGAICYVQSKNTSRSRDTAPLRKSEQSYFLKVGISELNNARYAPNCGLKPADKEEPT